MLVPLRDLGFLLRRKMEEERKVSDIRSKDPFILSPALAQTLRRNQKLNNSKLWLRPRILFVQAAHRYGTARKKLRIF